MTEIVVFPEAKLTLEEVVKKVHEISQNSANVYLDNSHVKKNKRERLVTNKQIFDVLQYGVGIDGPYLDEHGDWRIKLKKFTCGRKVQVVIALKKDNKLVVITVI